MTAATAVLLLGFATLAALSATGRWDVGHSMWHYRSATWGDALVLPVILAVLAAAVTYRGLARTRRDTAWGVAGAAAFALAGAAVQASWLAASDPVLNWTLPEPHRFSFPGWYHAVFLVFTAAAIGAMTAVAAHRLRAAPSEVRERLARGRPAIALMGGVIAFGVLLALDSADSVDTAAGQGSTAGAAASVFCGFVLATVCLGAVSAARLVLTSLPVAGIVVATSAVTHGWPA